MSIVKDFILRHKHISAVVLYFRKLQKDIELYFVTSKKLKKCIALDEQKLFYIGIPAHTNLGDLAQGGCIRKWIKENYNDRYVVEIETNSLVNTRFSLLGEFKKVFNASKDIIIFQSGYTTTDLGGYADEMHRAVIECVPNAKILMMPQTIFFRNMEGLVKAIKDICERKSINTEECLARSKCFDQNERFREYIDLYQNVADGI